jgi:hypothetical protein
MADVIEISSFRKPKPTKPTTQELSVFCTDQIQQNWERFARGNQLNDFFISNLPSYAQPSVNYLEDLNALSGIEQKIGLEPQVCAPGVSPDNALGWIAAFRVNGAMVATPFMPTEQYARCFNILLFLKLKRELVTNEIPVTT